MSATSVWLERCPAPLEEVADVGRLEAWTEEGVICSSKISSGSSTKKRLFFRGLTSVSMFRRAGCSPSVCCRGSWNLKFRPRGGADADFLTRFDAPGEIAWHVTADQVEWIFLELINQSSSMKLQRSTRASAASMETIRPDELLFIDFSLIWFRCHEERSFHAYLCSLVVPNFISCARSLHFCTIHAIREAAEST